jgi:hypothetical protein
VPEAMAKGVSVVSGRKGMRSRGARKPRAMTRGETPYGDGHAADRVAASWRIALQSVGQGCILVGYRQALGRRREQRSESML